MKFLYNYVQNNTPYAMPDPPAEDDGEKDDENGSPPIDPPKALY